MRIAICDPEQNSQAVLRAILNRYQHQRTVELQPVCFENAEAYLAELERGSLFDLVFSEILLPGLNGIEAARRLRQQHPELPLIFVTASRDHALDAYGVKARDYLLKPLKEEAVFSALDDIKKREARCLLLHTHKGIKKVFPHQLVYGEVQGHNMVWHFSTGETAESRCSIQQALDMVKPFGTFCQVHRAFFVNLDHVAEMRRTELVVLLEGGAAVYVPKAKFGPVYQQYQDFLQNKCAENFL